MSSASAVESQGIKDARHLQVARALTVTGLILYVPANIIPVMTMTVVGNVEPLTVMGGVQELYHSGLAPIAAIVFLASVLVPFCKLGSLTWLLFLHGTTEHQHARSVVLRLVHKIGSWSMVDVFLLSILAAVGQLGVLASVTAEPGALFFAACLVCTLFASESYKPRFIWQNDSLPHA